MAGGYAADGRHPADDGRSAGQVQRERERVEGAKQAVHPPRRRAGELYPLHDLRQPAQECPALEPGEALFLAVHDRELERITSGPVAVMSQRATWSRLSTRRLVDRVVDLLVAHYAEERALLRAFILRAAVDARVRTEGSHYVGQLEEATVDLLLTRRDDYRPPDVDRAVRTAYRIVVDSLSWRTAFGADFHPGGDVGDEQWAAELRDIIRTHLLGAEPGRR
jgi:hypothetical protein